LLAVNAGTENWLLDLAEAGEIIATPTITPVPQTRPWFRGLANVRGNLYSVVDFAAFCGEAQTPLTSEARILLIGTKHGMNTALLVNRAVGLRNPEDFDADDQADTREWVSGAVRDSQDRLWRKLSVRPLLVDAHFLDAALETHV